MYNFSQRSKDRLATCDPRLQEICNEVIKIYDITILDGHRDEETQNRYFSTGASKLQWPNSKHNSTPSLAIDISPYPLAWDNLPRFYYMAGLIVGIGIEKGYNIEWGGTWRSLKDYVHFEIEV